MRIRLSDWEFEVLFKIAGKKICPLWTVQVKVARNLARLGLVKEVKPRCFQITDRGREILLNGGYGKV